MNPVSVGMDINIAHILLAFPILGATGTEQ